jgi:hypothetical protein
MSAVAALLSLALFFVFMTSGLQKVFFSTAMSAAAEHVGFTKSAFQRIGVLEALGALGLVAGLSAKGGFFLFVNDVAAWCLAALMAGAAVTHFRKGHGLKGAAPAIVLGSLVALEAIFRLLA